MTSPTWAARMLRGLVPPETWVPVYGSPAWHALAEDDPLRLAAAIRAAERWSAGVAVATEELAASVESTALFERAGRIGGVRRLALRGVITQVGRRRARHGATLRR